MVLYASVGNVCSGSCPVLPPPPLSLRPPWVWRFTFLFVKLSTHPLAVLTCDLAPTERRDERVRERQLHEILHILKVEFFFFTVIPPQTPYSPPPPQRCLVLAKCFFSPLMITLSPPPPLFIFYVFTIWWIFPNLIWRLYGYVVTCKRNENLWLKRKITFFCETLNQHLKPSLILLAESEREEHVRN